MTDHPDKEDYRNRMKRAEEYAAELHDKIIEQQDKRLIEILRDGWIFQEELNSAANRIIELKLEVLRLQMENKK
jgi:galactokinase/mevalonate kinase-like predicted kinase